MCQISRPDTAYYSLGRSDPNSLTPIPPNPNPSILHPNSSILPCRFLSPGQGLALYCLIPLPLHLVLPKVS
jgi:hypothetical protein